MAIVCNCFSTAAISSCRLSETEQCSPQTVASMSSMDFAASRGERLSPSRQPTVSAPSSETGSRAAWEPVFRSNRLTNNLRNEVCSDETRLSTQDVTLSR